MHTDEHGLNELMQERGQTNRNRLLIASAALVGLLFGAVGAGLVFGAFLPFPSPPFAKYGLTTPWSPVIVGALFLYGALMLGRWADRLRKK